MGTAHFQGTELGCFAHKAIASPLLTHFPGHKALPALLGQSLPNERFLSAADALWEHLELLGNSAPPRGSCQTLPKRSSSGITRASCKEPAQTAPAPLDLLSPAGALEMLLLLISLSREML